MTNLLKNIISVLPAAQQAAINALVALKKKANEITSVRGQQQEANRIYNSIKTKLGKILLNPRQARPLERISSADHNANMEEIFLDLNALYSNIDQLAKVSLMQSVSLESEYKKSRASVEKLLNDARIFALRKKHLDFNEIKYIDFNTSSNQSKTSPKAEVSPKVRLLQSKQIDTTRIHLINRGARNTKIYTKTIATGIKGGLAKSFPPELMVDQKPETFWTTLIMSDAPVEQTYEKQTRNGVNSQVVVSGPVVEVYFKFSHAERINHIRLLPFAEYPIRILDISYKPSVNSAIFFSIDDFKETTTLDWEEYNFESIYAHEVRITIAQENAKQNIYQVPKSLVRNTDIFQKIYDAKLAKVIGNQILDSDYAVQLLNTVSNYETALELLEESYKSMNIGAVSNTPLETYYDFTKIVSELLSYVSPNINYSSILMSSRTDLEEDNALVEVRKFEYLLGIRELELGYAVYSPVSYYESEKFNIQATLSQVQLEVEERHVPVETQWQTDYHKTSTEWSVDLGGGRVVPIHPRNIVSEVDDVPAVKDERIEFDTINKQALTRLGGLYSSVYALKKDGQLVPPDQYRVSRQTGAIPNLQIEFTGSAWYSTESVYTVDYAVDRNSYDIQIIERYNSRPLDTPDTFTSVGSDNEITLSKFPFINYEVINLTGFFEKLSGDSSWQFIPPQQNVSNGQLKVVPTILDSAGNVLQEGSITGYTITGLWGLQSGVAALPLQGNAALSTNYFGNIDGINFGYFVQLMDSRNLYEVSSFTATHSFLFNKAPEVTLAQIQSWESQATGVVFVGDLTGATSGYLNIDYVLGIGVKTDDKNFALSQNSYSPITVTVGSRAANNITDYVALQHPAFSISSNRSNAYEYIHAGKKIYFNQPIVGQEIKVEYDWISDYIKILGTIRSNQKINPDLTAKVNSIKLLLNNQVI